MIFKKVDTFDEKFNDETVRKIHYDKHVTPDGLSMNVNPHNNKDYEFTKYEFPTEEEYENSAEILAKSIAYGSNLSNEPDKIKGFIGTDNRYRKYNPLTGEFTIYVYDDKDKIEPITITYHLIDDNRYNREYNKFYKSDIIDNK